MTTTAPPPAPTGSGRLSGLFVGMILLALALTPFALLAPLVALATPLRRSRREMRILWIVALAVTAVGWGLALFADSGLWPDWLILDSEEHAAAR